MARQTEQAMNSSATAAAAPALRAGNPITPPGMYIADPEGHQWADGRLYVYGSRDENKDYYCSHRYHVLSTRDLIHWDVDQDAFATRGPNAQAPYTDHCLYAPDCAYRDGTYYLYYCLASGGKDEGVATSKSPYGPFVNGRIIEGINQIDPAVLVDDDGQAYIYWAQFNSKAAKLKPNMLEIQPGTIVDNLLTEKEHFFHEGSSIRKRNGIYYMVYAHIGRRARPTCLGYATSNSPLGPFKYQGVVIDNYGSDPEVWNNHGSIVEFDGKWYVLYHRSTHASVAMRKACIEPITFNPDGTIPEVEMTSQGAGSPLSAFVRIEAEAACLLTGHVRIEQFGESQEQLAQLNSGDTAAYKYVDFGTGPASFTAKTVGLSAGGKIEIHLDSADGELIGTCDVAPDANAHGWAIHTCSVKPANGVHAVYLKFTGGAGNLFGLDWFTFGPQR